MDLTPRNQMLVETRAYEIGLCATGQPLKMMPIEIAIIPEVYPLGPVPRLANMVQRYNVSQYDRLSQKGYALNLVKGEYEKIES
jgi:hypothetical protein